MTKKLLTAESVTEGHPDKVADRISDAILDALLSKDPQARVACETVVTTGLVFVTGEITTTCYVDIPKIVRDTVKEIGYTRAKFGFDGDTCAVLTALDEQSPDIALGVNQALEVKTGELIENTLGAGDQGIMFGYATQETPEYMPLNLVLAHKLVQRLAEVRRQKILPYLRPDGKSQVTVEYQNGQPLRVDTVVLSAQHSEAQDLEQIRADLLEKVIQPIIPQELIDQKTRYFINPTGRFVIGGPLGDAGLTGRKIIVDTYGGMARHGGGAFSGKDPTKVDRSASYAARYVAKNIVAAGLAEKCEVELAYAIGVASPVSIMIETFGTNKIPEERIIKAVRELFDLRPAGIIESLDLRRPLYKQVSAYGHFGRLELNLPWEKLDKVEKLQQLGVKGGSL
ncbi:MAG TPA: methionine adenosyltransferase [Clostridia bacterium]|nr:methionine adenosyltransferase [Clostridia bacterium]